MKRKFLSILTAGFILVTSIGVSAGPVSADNGYSKNCTTSADVSTGKMWDRNPAVTGAMTGVRLDIIAQALEPCWLGVQGSKPSKSWELASLDGQLNGTRNFVQFGLGKSRVNGIDQTYFYWTPNPGNGGVFGQMAIANWVDFGTGSVVTPVGDVGYSFRIELVNYVHAGQPSRRQWRFTIVNQTTGATDSTTINTAGTAPITASIFSGQAWWGCETGTAANALGTGGSAVGTRSYMTSAGYKLAGDNLWHYTQNSTVFKPVLWTAPFQNFYHVVQDQGGPNSTDRVYCYTDSH